ncbi:MAG: hypothetical protein AAGU21_17980 [Solidesulfovibrio sp.]|uniref:hypothetical protein n=1 Tax=Solidesulfovibrio sp. TaxID=2910990 RepID=UPI003158B7D8
MRNENYDMPSVKTRYGDYLFRSKLEAKWAVFMDLLCVSYKYEPEKAVVGVNFFECTYIPDFFLDEIELYLEIKPRLPVDKELRKAAAWANVMGNVVFFHELAPNNGRKMSYSSEGSPIYSRDDWWWSECPRCLKIDIAFKGIPTCGCYSEEELDKMSGGGLKDIDFEKTKNILNAFSIAKNYKFVTPKKIAPLNRRFGLL